MTQKIQLFTGGSIIITLGDTLESSLLEPGSYTLRPVFGAELSLAKWQGLAGVL
ncbi:MAG: hypothetical protein HKL96_03465 [Phycisphaerales bacterium]|nr:hypothetical protein [Phycisphaerales bacterium]